jgi:hypothetical protein
MAEIFVTPDLQQADTLLTELLEDVKQNAGFFSGGENIPLPKSAAAVKNILDTKVRFGSPYSNLVYLTEETFKLSGTELNGIYQQQMHNHYDFYYMTLSVDLIPKPGAKFWRLTCEMDFGPKGSSEPIVQTIFPKDKWREVMNFGVGMDLGLDGSLDWNAGVDSSQLTQIMGNSNIPVEVKAKVANKDGFKAFITIPAYKYELGQSQILASGEDNSVCYWRIQDQELQKIGTMKFATVFKVPKGVESITLRGIAWPEPNMDWLTADVRDVLRALQGKFRSLINSGEEGASQLARGVGEQWTLTLPKAVQSA